jgi:anaerobic selenocysteine-containing dehydrogenase
MRVKVGLDEIKSMFDLSGKVAVITGGPVRVYVRDGRIIRMVILQQKCIEPVGQSKSDYDIFALLAKRLGLFEAYSEGGMKELDWVKRYFNLTDLPNGAIFWNEASQTPQKCSLCCHLLDEGWNEPRCVQACPTGALRAFKLGSDEWEQWIKAESLSTRAWVRSTRAV